MKYILIILILYINVSAQNYKEFAAQFNYEVDYNTAVKKAKLEKKDIMFFMIANFCPWCSKFEKVVLSKNKINEGIHKKFIPLILNREEHNFPDKFKAPIVPIIYIVDYKTNKIKNEIVGYSNRYKFIRLVQE